MQALFTSCNGVSATNAQLSEAEIAKIPFLTALAGALRRCSSLVWPATPRSSRLALHPASSVKKGSLLISASLSNYRVTIRRRLRAVAPSERDLTGD